MTGKKKLSTYSVHKLFEKLEDKNLIHTGIIIIPEVFEVQDATCIIRPDAPLTDGLRIVEAAEACPVEVIKFDK